jgi:hypothetical protein
MDKTQILVIGRNPDIVQTVVRLINNNPCWQATYALTDQEAIRNFAAQAFNLVLFGGGIEPQSDQYLRQAFTARRPGVTIIQHYGGGSGLLATEINMALESLL